MQDPFALDVPAGSRVEIEVARRPSVDPVEPHEGVAVSGLAIWMVLVRIALR